MNESSNSESVWATWFGNQDAQTVTVSTDGDLFYRQERITCPNCLKRYVREADQEEWNQLMPMMIAEGEAPENLNKVLLVCDVCDWYGIITQNNQWRDHRKTEQ